MKKRGVFIGLTEFPGCLTDFSSFAHWKYYHMFAGQLTIFPETSPNSFLVGLPDLGDGLFTVITDHLTVFTETSPNALFLCYGFGAIHKLPTVPLFLFSHPPYAMVALTQLRFLCVSGRSAGQLSTKTPLLTSHWIWIWLRVWSVDHDTGARWSADHEI